MKGNEVCAFLQREAGRLEAAADQYADQAATMLDEYRRIRAEVKSMRRRARKLRAALEGLGI